MAMDASSECMVGVNHILSQLGGLEEHLKLPSGVSANASWTFCAQFCAILRVF